MENTELAEWETLKRSTVNYSLQLRVNFLKDAEKVSRFQTMKLRRYNPNFKFRFLVTVFPNGANDETEGWLVVLQDVRIPKHEPRPRDYGILSCTVSVIDTEGCSRLPRSFVKINSDKEDRFPKYVERSLIVNRKDEFLTSGVLTVRCDIHFYIKTIYSEGLIHRILKEYLSSVPQEVSYKDICQTDDISPKHTSDTFTVFDFTRQILTLPAFDGSRKRYGVYGMSPVVLPSVSESEEDSPDFLEHVWLFDTESARFLVSLDEGHDSLGTRLLKASSVLKRGINLEMKEVQEKRYRFSDATSRTFIIVLYFLEKGILPISPNRDFLDVYKFSHFYDMGTLLQICAEEMAKSLEFSTEELKTIAKNYSDEYLSELLVSRWQEDENLEQPVLRKFERLNSDSYI